MLDALSNLDLDGVAGFAALINSLMMWPTIKALKTIAEDHGKRLTSLEEAPKRRPRRRRR